ncbi:MAG: serine hydrolase [Acidobacteria bacterium]|nr:serine hydrolase [Acidobacteriota bacterium]
MKACFRSVCVIALSLSIMAAANGQTREEIEIVKPKAYSPLKASESAELKKTVDDAVKEVLPKFKDLGSDQIAMTVFDMSDPANIRRADHRGEEQIYPASVVKMFYMVTLHQQLEDGKLKMTPELERGLRDMIVVSSNDATQYIVDVLTQTASGGELPDDEFSLWSHRRNRMNRYFASMGYTNINVNQKTYCEDAYGVEQQFRNYRGNNRNMITTNAAARLIAEIATGKAVNPARSQIMMDLMKRDPYATGREANSQATEFVGKAFLNDKIEGAKLWSKAGWTSTTRHDAAYFELPDGRKLAIAIFTVRHSNDKELIPTLASKVLEKLKGK